MPLSCAVIGNPIEHSLSPLIHHFFAKQFNMQLNYIKIQGEEASFAQQVAAFFQTQGKGLNITLPFKQKAYALADVVSERCKQAEAANTLWQVNNQIYADNTDGVGLIRDLSRHMTLVHSKILILGAGGAARGIIHPLLEKEPYQITVANRSQEPLQALQKVISSIQCTLLTEVKGTFDLIINATSAGVKGESFSLPHEIMRSHPFCYDLSYHSKSSTAFVAYAKQLGCNAIDGLGMLVEQAAESFFLWHGRMPDSAAVLKHLTRRG